MISLPTTVPQILAGIRSKQFSCVELIQATYQNIESKEPQIQAFLYLSKEQALQQAQAADQRLTTSSPEELPPLFGLPIGVKDVLNVTDMPTTAGSKILSGYTSPYTATAVQKLIDAGCIIIGKTNTDEFAMGSSTENSAYQTSHNPWNLDHVPGGSSGGSAAAVASGMLNIALGTDTGGSIRQPCSFCGTTGIKPTYGRVSRYGLIAYASSLDSVGVIGHSAQEITPIYQHMTGHDPKDSTSTQVPAQPTPQLTSLAGIKVGIPQEYFIEGIQPEVKQKVNQAVQKMAELGAEVIPVSLPHTQYALPVYYIIAPAEASANLARFDGVRYGLRQTADTHLDLFKQTRGQGFGNEVKRRIMLGTYALSAGYYDAFYGKAQKVRQLIRQDFINAFQIVDCIAAPVAPTTAFKIGEHTNDPLAMYLEDVFTLPANLAGVPGVAFPVGFDQSSLPVGMQLMGNYYSEHTLLAIAAHYQANTNWHAAAPQF